MALTTMNITKGNHGKEENVRGKTQVRAMRQDKESKKRSVADNGFADDGSRQVMFAILGKEFIDIPVLCCSFLYCRSLFFDK